MNFRMVYHKMEIFIYGKIANICERDFPSNYLLYLLPLRFYCPYLLIFSNFNRKAKNFATLKMKCTNRKHFNINRQNSLCKLSFTSLSFKASFTHLGFLEFFFFAFREIFWFQKLVHRRFNKKMFLKICVALLRRLVHSMQVHPTNII